MKVCAHTLVRNEDRFLWYAVRSVIDYVDKVLIWDTGSGDKTLEIIKKLKESFGDKIDFLEYGEVDPVGFTKVRQLMLEATKADFVLTADGDEVWWDDSIKQVLSSVQKNPRIESVFVKTINLVGDMYHYQDESAGRYQVGSQKGHFNLRLFSANIPGLHAKGEHGKQGYWDENDTPIQDRGRDKVQVVDVSYLHMTHLVRSTRNMDRNVPLRSSKFKYEIGRRFPLDYYYPEALFWRRPAVVDSPWAPMSRHVYLRSLAETLPRRIKRRLLI